MVSLTSQFASIIEKISFEILPAEAKIETTRKIDKTGVAVNFFWL
jgi:hypothetical protein